MHALYTTTLLAHIIAGAVGLLSMLAPLLARKGGRLHRRAGWVFVVSMGLASLTGLVIAALWLVAPLEARPPRTPLDPAAQARYVEQLRTMSLFFGFIAVLVASSLWQGLVALRQRRGTIAWGNPVDRVLAVLTTGLGALLMVVGTVDVNLLLLGFGVLGVSSGIADLRFYARRSHDPRAWMQRHLQAMIGGATAATTAFTVQFVGRTLAEAGHGGWMLVCWGLPPALGMLASHLWTRRVAPKPR